MRQGFAQRIARPRWLACLITLGAASATSSAATMGASFAEVAFTSIDITVRNTQTGVTSPWQSIQWMPDAYQRNFFELADGAVDEPDSRLKFHTGHDGNPLHLTASLSVPANHRGQGEVGMQVWNAWSQDRLPAHSVIEVHANY